MGPSRDRVVGSRCGPPGLIWRIGIHGLLQRHPTFLILPPPLLLSPSQAILHYQCCCHHSRTRTSLPLSSPMATVSAASIRLAASSFSPNESNGGLGNAKWVSFAGMPKSGFSSWRSSSRRSICCAAKPQTVAKVIEIVKKQLALEDNTDVTAASEFSKLGADSLDTVEIVMALEEEFGINVDEDSSPDISTVQEAADLIEKLVEQKAQAA